MVHLWALFQPNVMAENLGMNLGFMEGVRCQVSDWWFVFVSFFYKTFNPTLSAQFLCAV